MILLFVAHRTIDATISLIPSTVATLEAEKESIISSFQSSVQQIVSAFPTATAKIKSTAVSNVDQAVATLSSLLSISAQIASERYSTLNSIASKVQMSASPQLPHPTDGKASYPRFAVDISDLLRKFGPALTDAISSLTSAITSVLNSTKGS